MLNIASKVAKVSALTLELVVVLLHEQEQWWREGQCHRRKNEKGESSPSLFFLRPGTLSQEAWLVLWCVVGAFPFSAKISFLSRQSSLLPETLSSARSSYRKPIFVPVSSTTKSSKACSVAAAKTGSARLLSGEAKSSKFRPSSYPAVLLPGPRTSICISAP